MLLVFWCVENCSRQQSRNVLRPSSLELATSLLGASRLRREKLLAFRELFGAKALYLKRARTLIIIQHYIRWLDFAAEIRLKLAIVVFGEEVFLV